MPSSRPRMPTKLHADAIRRDAKRKVFTNDDMIVSIYITTAVDDITCQMLQTAQRQR